MPDPTHTPGGQAGCRRAKGFASIMEVKKLHTLKVKNKDLWPSTFYLGSAVVKFLVGRRGRSVKVEQRGRKPRHKKREGA